MRAFSFIKSHDTNRISCLYIPCKRNQVMGKKTLLRISYYVISYFSSIPSKWRTCFGLSVMFKSLFSAGVWVRNFSHFRLICEKRIRFYPWVRWFSFNIIEFIEGIFWRISTTYWICNFVSLSRLISDFTK